MIFGVLTIRCFTRGSVAQRLGAALLASGKPAEAEQVFRADLQQNPRNPRSLYGLMETLRIEKKDANAAWERTREATPKQTPAGRRATPKTKPPTEEPSH